MAAQYEYGLSKNWGIGLNVNYAVAKAKFTAVDVVVNGDTVNLPQTVRWGVTSFIIRGNYHISTDGPLDPYIGIGLGLRTGGISYQVKYKYLGYSRGLPLFVNPFGAEATLGIRYYVHEHIALFGEIGMAQAFIKGGLVIRLLPNK
jgi:outer membrane protein W